MSGLSFPKIWTTYCSLSLIPIGLKVNCDKPWKNSYKKFVSQHLLTWLQLINEKQTTWQMISVSAWIFGLLNYYHSVTFLGLSVLNINSRYEAFILIILKGSRSRNGRPYLGWSEICIQTRKEYFHNIFMKSKWISRVTVKNNYLHVEIWAWGEAACW